MELQGYSSKQAKRISYLFFIPNVYLIGVMEPKSPEGIILGWLGWEVPNNFGVAT